MSPKFCVEAGYVCPYRPKTSICELDQSFIRWYKKNPQGLRSRREEVKKLLEDGKVTEVRRMCLRASSESKYN